MSAPGRDHCTVCGSSLTKPGDYCLVCRSANADGVVIDATAERATLTMLDGETVLGETTIKTTPETGERERTYQRNFAGRIADEVRRKRPETVYMAGERDVLARVGEDVHVECFRVEGTSPVDVAIARRGDRDLDVVEAAPAEKIGGTHTTLVGGRDGRRVIEVIARHPHVKKVIPGPIESGGSSGSGGVRAKVTRADANGNLRLLVRDGSSVQENRIVTTAMDRDRGERIATDLDELLTDAELDR